MRRGPNYSRVPSLSMMLGGFITRPGQFHSFFALFERVLFAIGRIAALVENRLQSRIRRNQQRADSLKSQSGGATRIHGESDGEITGEIAPSSVVITDTPKLMLTDRVFGSDGRQDAGPKKSLS